MAQKKKEKHGLRFSKYYDLKWVKCVLIFSIYINFFYSTLGFKRFLSSIEFQALNNLDMSLLVFSVTETPK